MFIVRDHKIVPRAQCDPHSPRHVCECFMICLHASLQRRHSIRRDKSPADVSRVYGRQTLSFNARRQPANTCTRGPSFCQQQVHFSRWFCGRRRRRRSRLGRKRGDGGAIVKSIRAENDKSKRRACAMCQRGWAVSWVACATRTFNVKCTAKRMRTSELFLNAVECVCVCLCE